MADRDLTEIHERLGVVDNELKHFHSRLEEHMSNSKESNEGLAESLKQIENHVASLNSVDRKLLDIGIDLNNREEHQKDQAFLRKNRLRSEGRSKLIERTVLTIVVVGIVGFVGTAVWEKFINDSQKPQQIQIVPQSQLPPGFIPQNGNTGSTTGQTQPSDSR